ncbi:hypothetical protein INR49_028244 [Caranx melampygus]|nr:hypothetical protein INR49_028244 [Caranx melampygus]
MPHTVFLTAQPITSKLDEGWWAYKDVVQESFIPGNRQAQISCTSRFKPTHGCECCE